MSDFFKHNPAVFAVNKHYQIMMPCEKACLFFVRVGDKYYYDESNGIMCSRNKIHKVEVPANELDNAKQYTVCIRPIIWRKAYFSKTKTVVEKTFRFYPIPENNIRAYHISDAHNNINEPIKAAEAFGEIDFLILNGDVIEDSSNPSKFMNIFEICSKLTKGEKPSIFSRGNHDLRGNYAEKFASYTPAHNGNTYYSFRIGNIWGILLDCGEDKNDNHPEYGFTVACHPFRKRQTEFLKSIIENKETEYDAKDVRHKIVISHNAFSHRYHSPFDIEQDIFADWTKLLRENVKPEIMICGHAHELNIYYPDNTEWNTNGSVCPVVIGSTIKKSKPVYFAGCGYIFSDDKIEIIFTDSNGETLGKESLDITDKSN
ncbi:MAG: metallophosphoesterase [Clostridia bacterium]|nr:metallophosphoesterase [Clostridia bacterium]